MPLVSVIVPNYNHAAFLKQRIDSILNQSLQDFELILLDDCSTDNSREVLSSYAENPHVSHLVFSETNSGSPFSQWQKGIALAQGEWIWIAESDDWADEHFLEILLSEAHSHPSAGLLYAKAQYRYTGCKTWCPQLSNKTIFHKGVDFIKQQLLYANVIYNVSMVLFRKSLIKDLDFTKFDNMHLCGDWFFYTLLCEHTDVLEVDKLLSYYRVHNANSSYVAECEGRTFMEGLDVLDYILARHPIPQRAYSRQWGRRLAKYQIKYQYSVRIRNMIKRRLRRNHKLILLYYFMYQLKNAIR
ncbi:MAG: glycosyltransferase family 2 protein [Paludibacteraceae bacterium]|nr:glycosyltransferase family 2 protein [Paludibacteraceae bacterium]